MKKIGELLVEQGKLSERDVERTLLAQAEMGDMFAQVLVKLGLVSEQDVAVALSQQLDIPLQLASEYPEEALRRSEEDLRITLDSIGDAVIATDADGRVTRVNPAAEQLIGWVESEAVGRDLGPFFQRWGVPTSEAARAQLRDLEAWLPE